MFYCNKFIATKHYCNENFVVITYCHRVYCCNGQRFFIAIGICCKNFQFIATRNFVATGSFSCIEFVEEKKLSTITQIIIIKYKHQINLYKPFTLNIKSLLSNLAYITLLSAFYSKLNWSKKSCTF